jgi:HSP20 family protein
MMSSFLDSMIPREHISDMNQFDFACDIVEKKDRYTLSGELPGCNVDNVDIKMDKDNNLHVSAHKSTKHEEDEQSPDGRMKWHAIERSSGRVERIFTLPTGADPEQIEASMKDGILTIDVKKKPEAIGEPKKKEEELKSIPIKAQ